MRSFQSLLSIISGATKNNSVLWHPKHRDAPQFQHIKRLRANMELMLSSGISVVKQEYGMARTVNFAEKIRKIAASLEELASAIEAQPTGVRKSFPAGNGKSASKRVRRSKKEAAALKRLVKAERKAGVPVAELAKKHGISTAYIYMLH
jgi:hypothetical protein